MSDIEFIKCACNDCVCVMPVNKAVKHNGRYYCGDVCAGNHGTSAGCGHVGCECRG